MKDKLFVQNHGTRKIALFIPTLSGGGAERIMINLAVGLVDKGIAVDILVGAQGSLQNEVPKEARLIDFKVSRTLACLPSLVRYLKRERPTAMLSAMAHANIVAICAKYLAFVKTCIYVSVHNTISYNIDKRSLKGWFQLLLIKLFYPFSNAIIVVSEEAKEDFIVNTGISNKKVQVIYNPVVTPDIFEKAKQPVNHPWLRESELPVILGVGRLTKQKDFITLIRAFSIVLKQFPIRMIILGEGEDRQLLEKLVLELNLSKYVDLHGFVDNPYAYISRASVFVLSSAWEGLPTVLIESLALGVPVVATECPSGPKEILNNGKYGILVPVGDKAAIAKSILLCLQTNTYKKVPEESWERFELKQVTKKYIELFSGRGG